MGNKNTQQGIGQAQANVANGSGGIASQNAQLNSQYNPAQIQQQLNQSTQAQLQNATNQGIQNAAGVVSSTKGINPALAGRLAGQQAAGQLQNAANQSSMNAGQNALAANQIGLQAQGQIGSNLGTLVNSGQSGINASNSANSGANTSAANAGLSAVQGAASGAGSALGSLNKGGFIPSNVNYADGGSVQPAQQSTLAVAPHPLAYSGMHQLGNAIQSLGGPSASTPPQNPQQPDSANQQKPSFLGSITSPATASQAGQNVGSGVVNGIASLFRGDPSPAVQQGDPSMVTTGNGQQVLGANSEGPGYAKGGRIPMYAKGGKVDAMVSPGEKYISPRELQKVKEGKKSALAAGKTIPGKEVVKGPVDTLKNDIKPKKLEAGGVILPKSVTKSKDKSRKANQFVAAIMANQHLKRR